MCKNLTVGILKKIISNLPDDMEIIVPVIDERNIDVINGLKMGRAVAILEFPCGIHDSYLCINTSTKNIRISDQIQMSNIGKSIMAYDILFDKTGVGDNND